MADQQHDEENSRPKGKWRRRIWISLGIILALLLIFHRPLLLGAIHWFAVRAAAKENLKLDFRAEGNVFTALTIRNLHLTPTGPAVVEAADADYVRAEYNLWELLRGRPDFLKTIEARNLRAVIDPAKARVKAQPRPHEKVSLPAIFPERAKLENVTVIVRDPAHDLIAQNVSLELNPRAEGSLSIDLLQLPTGEAWSHVTGRTSYENRNLALHDVVLNAGTRFRLLNIDASHLREHNLRLRIDATLDGAPLNVEASLTEQARSLFIQSHLTTRGLALASAKKLGLLADQPVDGILENVALDLAGLLSSPRTWNASGNAAIRDLRVAGTSFDRAVVQLLAHDGVATIQPLDLRRAGGSLQAHASIQLPERIDELARSPAKLEIVSSDLDLAPITASLTKPIAGGVQVNGSAEIRDQVLRAEFRLASEKIQSADFQAEKVEAKLTGSRKMEQPSAAPWFQGIAANISLDARNLRGFGYVADSLSAQIEQDGDQVRVRSVQLARGPNEIAASGSAQLRAEAKDFSQHPAQANISIVAPEMGDFWQAATPDRVTGNLVASANVVWDGANAKGAFQIHGANLLARNLPIPQLDAAGALDQSKIFLNDLTAKLNQRDFVNAQGTLELLGEKVFSGKLAIDIADLKTLEPLLAATGNKSQLGGAFVMNWEGRGSLEKLAENGALTLTWNHGRLGNMQALQANIDAKYSPDGLEIPTIYLGSNRMDFQAIVSTKGETLEVSKIQLDQGKAKYAAGYISAPFIWKNVGTDKPLFPRDGKVNATFDSQNLDLKKLFDDLGIPPAATGFVSVKFEAGGTLANLRAHLEADARDLRNPKLPNLDPATFRVVADATEKKINVTGELKQPKIQPIAIAASMPFDAGEVLSKGSLDENAPLQATVRLPRSSVNFLRQFLPAVEQLDGDVALDVAIGGTIAHPVLSGSGDITINAARFTNGTLPALHGFSSRLNFRDNTLTLEKFRGDLAGGPFTLGGRVVFTKLTEPTLDLALRAESILVARNDTLTVRADGNINVTGPFATATVKGNVALTDSHFLKDIDLLPIGLPGRPAPEAIEDRPDYSIPEPPLRDWKFDVAIKTKDPFSIRGNLANGGAVVDVHLGGTGLHPELKGTVRMQNVEATLPFSRLQVTSGFLYFDPSDSFNPKIDLQGVSVVRDYTVRVYVYGSSLSPQAIFTSEPPLPQEEIISLLATGTTRQELAGNNSVLAGRAVLLIAGQLYRKIFKKGQPTQSNPVFDRLRLDLGSVDPRTGREQASARFKIDENWALVGDLGVGGEFRGQVKYLIRFH